MPQMVSFSFNTLYQPLHAHLAHVLDDINEAHYLSIPGLFTLDALYLIIVQDIVLKQDWQKLLNMDQLLEERQVFTQQWWRTFQFKLICIRSKSVYCDMPSCLYRIYLLRLTNRHIIIIHVYTASGV